MPKVLNKRTDKIPLGAVYVGRPSKWGNPYMVYPNRGDLKIVAHKLAVNQYKEYIMEHPELIEAAKSELCGKDLVCWCTPLPCHADVLLELANRQLE